jgi:hypothetical protein
MYNAKLRQQMLHAVLILVSSAALAADTKPVPIPSAEDIDPTVLNWWSRAALSKGVGYLRELGEKDPDGWVEPPHRTQTVIGSTNVQVRYREEKYDHPIYEYETYEVLQRVPGETSVSTKVLKKVQKQRIKRQIGTEKRVRLVHDPKGPIERTESRAIYDKGGPDVWRHGNLGCNALAVFALRKAGVPADDPVVQKVIENLTAFINTYGVPDTTWDLCWMAAAYSTMPAEYCRTLTGLLIGKILDGQITEGPARGLWGPVSLNTKVLRMGMAYEKELTDTLEKCKLQLKEGETADRRRRANAAEKALEDFQEPMRRFSLLGMAFDDVDRVVRFSPDDAPHIVVVGLPHYIYNQTTADIDSTAYALFAIRQVAEAGLLPEKTHRPPVGTGKILPAPEEPLPVLARCATALAAAQMQTGGWNQMNMHQPVNDFVTFRGMPGVPPDGSSFAPLKSKETVLSTAQGYAVLMDVGAVVGLDKLMGKFANNVARGMTSARKAAEMIVDADPTNDILGGYVPPYDCFLFLRYASRRFGGYAEDRRDLWSRIACRLVLNQQTNGAWSVVRPAKYTLFWPTSLEARMEALVPPGSEKTLLDLNRAKAHVGRIWYRSAYHNWWWAAYQRRVPATAFAMLVLADGVRPPTAGEWIPSGSKGESQVLPMVMAEVNKRFSVELSYAALDRGLPPEAADLPPALFVSARAPVTLDTAASKTLTAYLNLGGLLVAESPADAAGDEFRAQIKTTVLNALPQSTASDIGGDTNLLGEIAGKLKLDAVTRKDGRTAAVFLPLDPNGRPTDGRYSASIAGRIALELLIRRMNSEVLQDGYPLDLKDLGEVEKTLASTRDMLTGKLVRVREAPPAAEPAGTNAVTGGATNALPAEPTAPVKRADEVW